MAERLREYGHEDFMSYVVWTCERALERGLLPHTNLGVLDRDELGRLREVTASQGLMLESINPDLVVHQGSPTKHPARRLETIAAAGELRIPFTSGILVGIGESEEERVAALERLAELHAAHGHLQEVILQNFVPHQSYYGREPAQIADAASREYWGTGVWSGPAVDAPAWATRIEIEDMTRLVAEARRLMPDVGIQVPPNLSDWWVDLVGAGATDLGGLSANGDHISPEHPFPSPAGVRKRLQAEGVALTERLCVYPEYIDPKWISGPVMDVIKTRFWSFIPRRGSGRRGELTVADDAAPRAILRGREGLPLTQDELIALFAERRPAVIEEMRAAADELRAELAGDTVTFVVNRNINVSNVCVVGCAFCGFGQSRRSPDAYEHSEEEFARRVQEAIAFGATEICMQSGIHPDWSLEDYEKWLRLAKQVAPQLHLHAYSPMEISHMCDVSGLAPRVVFERLREAGLDSTPGTAAEVLHDGVRERISPNKLPVARWVEIIEASHATGIRSTVTVMFGHIEEPSGARRAHAGGARAPGAHRWVHRVRAAVVHPVPHAARTHARDRGNLIGGEPQAHRGVPAGARQDDHEPPGELGEDGSRRGDRVTAVGGQRPRRHADGGVDQPDGRQLPRGEARTGRPGRRRPQGRAARRRAHHAVRAPEALRASGSRTTPARRGCGEPGRRARERRSCVMAATDRPVLFAGVEPLSNT